MENHQPSAGRNHEKLVFDFSIGMETLMRLALVVSASGLVAAALPPPPLPLPPPPPPPPLLMGGDVVVVSRVQKGAAGTTLFDMVMNGVVQIKACSR